MITIELLYVATDARYLAECEESAATFRAHNRVHVTVATSPALVSNAASFSDVVLTMTEQGFLAKVKTIATYESQRFWFVDTDAFCVRELSRIDRLSSRYALMAARDPLLDTFNHVALQRPNNWPNRSSLLETEPNTGVIIFDKAKLNPDFMPTWLRRHQELIAANPSVPESQIQDQPSFHLAIEDHSVALGVLPTEMNFRCCYPGTLREAPYVIHSRQPKWRRVAESLKNVKDVTTFYPYGVRIARKGLLNRSSFALRRLLESRADLK